MSKLFTLNLCTVRDPNFHVSIATRSLCVREWWTRGVYRPECDRVTYFELVFTCASVVKKIGWLSIIVSSLDHRRSVFSLTPWWPSKLYSNLSFWNEPNKVTISVLILSLKDVEGCPGGRGRFKRSLFLQIKKITTDASNVVLHQLLFSFWSYVRMKFIVYSE